MISKKSIINEIVTNSPNLMKKINNIPENEIPQKEQTGIITEIKKANTPAEAQKVVKKRQGLFARFIQSVNNFNSNKQVAKKAQQKINELDLPDVIKNKIKKQIGKMTSIAAINNAVIMAKSFESRRKGVKEALKKFKVTNTTKFNVGNKNKVLLENLIFNNKTKKNRYL